MSRLGDILTQDEKIGLSLAMLEDVIEVVKGVEGIGPVVIVTRDSRVGKIAEKYGIEVIREPEETRGEGPAVDYGAGILEGRGIERLLVIPSDMPQVSGEDLETILAVDAGTPSVVMAPAHDGGTNGMLRRPPTVIPSRFGPDSLSLHLAGGGSGGWQRESLIWLVQGGRGYAGGHGGGAEVAGAGEDEGVCGVGGAWGEVAGHRADKGWRKSLTLELGNSFHNSRFREPPVLGVVSFKAK